MVRAFVLAVAFLAVTPALAQPAKAPTVVAAPQWRVDAANSVLAFASTIEGAPFRGTFARWSADIRFDPANLAGSSVRVIVDPTSVSSGLAARDRTLQESDWFDSGRHRQVVFQSTAVRSAGAGRYEAVGTLSVKGRATPVTLPFSIAITGATADAQGALSLDRLRLGLGAAIGPDLTPATVSVSFRVRATRV